MGRAKDTLKSLFFRMYRLSSRFGLAPVPLHYYGAEPNVIELERTKEVWSVPLSLRGINVDLDAQMSTLRETCLPYQGEYAGNGTYRGAVEEGFGPGYGYIEAQALHGVVRHFRPRKVVEVGSGVSTRCVHAALQRNALDGAAGTSLTCVEPFPSRRLIELAGADPSIVLIREPVQRVPLSLFDELDEGDLVFVDSSHVVKAGSDVVHMVLEVLPLLKEGVIVHFHDLYLPFEYQRDVLRTFLHANETALVVAFLSFNERFRILFSLSLLHYERGQELETVVPEYRPKAGWRGLDDPSKPGGHFPSATYLQVRGAGK
jgi:predicted O-methyltransferase YrrM